LSADHSRFCDVFLIARDVVEQVARNAGGSVDFPIPVKKGIIPVTAGRLSVGGVKYTIRTIRKDWRSSQFYSALFRYTDHADVVYSTSLNRCWKRFSACKEVAHLLVDDGATHFTTDVVGLIQRIITDAPFFEADSSIESEYMGVIIAIELLLPWKFRKKLEAMRDAGKTDLQIAEHARVPEKFVNLLLRSPYGETSKRINEQLDAAAQ